MLTQYWEDAADALREASGTLLPLWHFADARVRSRAVTALAWSPGHADLFAAAYGSFDAQAQVLQSLCKLMISTS